MIIINEVDLYLVRTTQFWPSVCSYNTFENSFFYYNLVQVTVKLINIGIKTCFVYRPMSRKLEDSGIKSKL